MEKSDALMERVMKGAEMLLSRDYGEVVGIDGDFIIVDMGDDVMLCRVVMVEEFMPCMSRSHLEAEMIELCDRDKLPHALDGNVKKVLAAECQAHPNEETGIMMTRLEVLH